MNRFLAEHADLTLIHLDNGVPWPEALSDQPFSDHLQDDWQGHRAAVPKDHELFVAITPLNMERDGLASYHGDSDNMSLPDPWRERSLDHPDVLTAYLAYAQRAVDFFQPDYLAIGIEVNLTLNSSEGLWDEYRRFHEEIYWALKEDHPELPIFATFTYPDMKGDRDDSAPAARHQEAVAELASANDLLGLSVYPYSYIYGGDGSLPANYFDLAASYDMPIAITESGMPSRSFKAFFVNYPFEVQHQTNYMQSMLDQAVRHRFGFVVNWANIDFEELLDDFPPGLRDLGRFWAWTGLETSDGCGKPSLEIWDAYLSLPRASGGGQK